MKIRELTISARSKACLLNAGYENVEDLEDISDEELWLIRNLNEKGVAEIRALIEDYFVEKDEPEDGEIMTDVIDDMLSEDVLDTLIADVGVSFRTKKILGENGIVTIRQLCRCSEEQVNCLRLFERNEKNEILCMMKKLGVFYRTCETDPFMYLYPDEIKAIQQEKDTAWEHLLFIEAAIANYKWLQTYRKQEQVLWLYEDEDKRIVDKSALKSLVEESLGIITVFASRVQTCMNNDINEAFGEPGKSGDAHKIIAATEKLMRIYQDIITWKLSLQNMYVAVEYRHVFGKLCQVVESLCKNYDVLYSKLLVAKKQLEDLKAGLINGKDLVIDLTITLNLDKDGLNEVCQATLVNDEDDGNGATTMFIVK